MLNKNTKKLWLLAAIAGFSVSAQATVYPLQASNIPTGSYSYSMSFDIQSGYVGALTGEVTSIYRSYESVIKSGFDITGMSLSSGTLNTTDYVTTSTPIPGVPTYKSTTEAFYFNAADLAAGHYTLTLYGYSYSPTANYTGGFELTTAVAAVPEPETSAMIGLGLGIIGLISMRRKP